MSLTFQELDPFTLAFELQVPLSRVVLLQSYFELYEGLGTVRTLREGARQKPRAGLQEDERTQIVQIMTPRGSEHECEAALLAIKAHVSWEVPGGQSTP